MAGAALGVALPPRTVAAVSDDDFTALKEMVTKQGQRLDQLQQQHDQDQKAIDQDQKTHQQDQQRIQQLEQQLGTTQQMATNAIQKAEAATQVQPIHPVANGASATHNVTISGDAEVQFGKFQNQHSGFALADFAPIFLFRGGDKVLFEAGFDITLGNNAPGSSGYSTDFNLSFATLDYLLNDYVTVVAGNMILPLGTYNERSAGWLNKFPDSPMPRSILQANGVGAQLRGAVPLGYSGQMLTYSAYGVNGPGSTQDGTTALQQNIDLTSGNVGLANMHSNPSGGGRLGWFMPWKPHYDLELGVSGQSGTWDNDSQYLWSAFVLDAALHISPYFEAKGELMQTWQGSSDLGTVSPKGGWVQAGYKLAGLNLDVPILNNLELMTRYDRLNNGLETTTDRLTAGIVYYFSNTLLLEGDYEWVRNKGVSLPPDQQMAAPGFLVQFSYGF